MQKGKKGILIEKLKNNIKTNNLTKKGGQKLLFITA